MAGAAAKAAPPRARRARRGAPARSQGAPPAKGADAPAARRSPNRLLTRPVVPICPEPRRSAARLRMQDVSRIETASRRLRPRPRPAPAGKRHSRCSRPAADRAPATRYTSAGAQAGSCGRATCPTGPKPALAPEHETPPANVAQDTPPVSRSPNQAPRTRRRPRRPRPVQDAPVPRPEAAAPPPSCAPAGPRSRKSPGCRSGADLADEEEKDEPLPSDDEPSPTRRRTRAAGLRRGRGPRAALAPRRPRARPRRRHVEFSRRQVSRYAAERRRRRPSSARR